MRKCGRLPLFSRLLRGLSPAAARAVVRWGVVAAAPVLSFCASNKTAAAAYAAGCCLRCRLLPTLPIIMCSCGGGCSRWLAVAAAGRWPLARPVPRSFGRCVFFAALTRQNRLLVVLYAAVLADCASRYTPALTAFLPLSSGPLARPIPRPWVPLCQCSR